MLRRKLLPWLLAVQLTAPGAAFGGPSPPSPLSQGERESHPDLGPGTRPPSEILLRGLEPPALAALAAEGLARNPGLARARQRAAAAAVRAPQVRALPDPVAALTLFVLPPETRTGPQHVSVSVSQKLPWFGKLGLREQAALYQAAAAEAKVEVKRLDLITETRRLFYELAFHYRHEVIVTAERETLVRYEEAARARYSAGAGLQQEILRIQAQITRIDTRFLEISEHGASLQAALNALRDRPAGTPVEGLELPPPTPSTLDVTNLREQAATRPELAIADAHIARHKTLVELAEKAFRPDVTVGVGFTLVGSRNDDAGRASPPEDEGDDILSFSGSVNLPVRRAKLEAALEEALALKRESEEAKRQVAADIERSIGDLTARLPLLYQHWRLLEKVLRVQAREGLRSAETAYTTGKLGAVDLLDAEVVLLDVRTAAARTLADYAVAMSQLERAVAAPISHDGGSP